MSIKSSGRKPGTFTFWFNVTIGISGVLLGLFYTSENKQDNYYFAVILLIV